MCLDVSARGTRRHYKALWFVTGLLPGPAREPDWLADADLQIRCSHHLSSPSSLSLSGPDTGAHSFGLQHRTREEVVR